MTSWFDDALDVLRRIEATDEAISNAMRLLYRLDRRGIKRPYINTASDGGVQLEWGIGDNYLEITCFESYGYFCVANGEEEGSNTLDPVATVIDCLGRFA